MQQKTFQGEVANIRAILSAHKSQTPLTSEQQQLRAQLQARKAKEDKSEKCPAGWELYLLEHLRKTTRNSSEHGLTAVELARWNELFINEWIKPAVLLFEQK